ncbi:hypothetical protein D8674_008567 [Pyrus ussuriensis x Pyrus communis]|uniref:Uncharacterized protein n=1 Tax=Pyrus ussuriensis x Pyrus communis TaxID=2448454 RepID=A0A5N5HU27_9ROSA|nr:hypothetical protein D8674_008567 [Pyrus ussuriensis x Pyrus communis]
MTLEWLLLSHYKKLQVGIFEEMVCDAQLTYLIDDMPKNKVGRGSGVVRGKAMGRGTYRERGMVSSSQPTIPPIQHESHGSLEGFGEKMAA